MRALPLFLGIAVAGTACAASPPAPPPPPAPASAAPPSPTPAPPRAAEDAPRLALSRVALSPEGTRIVAWQGGPSVGEAAPLCVVHLSPLTPVCITLPPTDPLEEDAPRFSANGTYLVMHLRSGLSVLDTARLRPAFTKELAAEERALASAPSPNERLLAWVDARGAARVVDIPTGAEVMSSKLGGPATTAKVFWSGDGKVVFAADGYAPEVWDLAKKSVDPAIVQGADWRGYKVAVRGDTCFLAGLDELVATLDLSAGSKATVVRPPNKPLGGVSLFLSTSDSGARFSVALGSQVDVFDTRPPALVVSTRVAKGTITGARLSPDGSRVGLGVDRTSFEEGSCTSLSPSLSRRAPLPGAPPRRCSSAGSGTPS